ncbi:MULTISPECIES: hypothetical protein [unclassified Corynebacterium]|uniref:hypothetical protein n=1 Tax=unclassified Corynebacterium TaxID=2624378 RepID=UPI002A91FCF0|nr:hypothetical protein [Corynebacterium sp.]MDY5785761.1 hypothetical protein [Corynebacterium sp.]
MKSLKPAAVSAVAASALLLAGCSAGQITQTADQVAAVDGAAAATNDNEILVQDVTVILGDAGQAALKFTAINQNIHRQPHSLESVTVDGVPVQLSGATQFDASCNLVGDSATALESIPQAESDCISYVATSLPNNDFAFAGNLPVEFTFDAGTIDVTATVSAPRLQSGEAMRDEAQPTH